MKDIYSLFSRCKKPYLNILILFPKVHLFLFCTISEGENRNKCMYHFRSMSIYLMKKFNLLLLRALRLPPLAQILFNLIINVPSASLQMTPNWEEWLRVMLQSRGTWTCWRNGLTGTSCNSSRGSSKSCIWGGAPPCTSTHWDQPAGKLLGREGSGGPSGHQADPKRAKCLCSKGGQWYPELC